jgi:hypothetical protein
MGGDFTIASGDGLVGYNHVGLLQLLFAMQRNPPKQW